MKMRQKLYLRHKLTGKYLCSIPDQYTHPSGSNQQIVGAHEQKEERCIWFFKPAHSNAQNVSAKDPVTAGHVRLEHFLTQKNLHSHTVRSPLSRQREVSAFGSIGYGDTNDDWDLSFVDAGAIGEIKLQHVATSHFLHSHSDQSHEQYTKGLQEVTGFSGSDDNNLWVIELHEDTSAVSAKPLFTLHISKKLPSKHFYALDQYSQWLRELESKWDWLKANANEPTTAKIQSYVHSKFTALEAAANSARSSVDGSNFEPTIAQLVQQTRQTFESVPSLYPDDSINILLAEISVTDPLVAAYTTGALFKVEGDYGSLAGTKGVIMANTIERGWLESGPKHDESLGILRSKWDEQFDQLKMQFEEIKSTGETALKQNGDSFQKQSENLLKLIGDGEKRLKAVEETYDKHMALKASVDYWTQKAERHRKAARNLSILATLLGIAAVWFLYAKFTSIALGVSLSDGQKVATTSNIPYWQYVAVALLATFIVWGLKILIRVMLSNLHQREDAEERVTMMKTFLALKRDQSITDNKDIQLVLSSLFRAGNPGIFKDETGPATPFEVVMKHIDKK